MRLILYCNNYAHLSHRLERVPIIMTYTRVLSGKITGSMWVDASPILLELTHFIKSSNVLNTRRSLVYKFFACNILSIYMQQLKVFYFPEEKRNEFKITNPFNKTCNNSFYLLFLLVSNYFNDIVKYIQISWRPVIWGLILQFVFGLIMLRWPLGRSIFECISGKVTTFLNYAKAGANFVFSEKIVKEGVFAFAVS